MEQYIKKAPVVAEIKRILSAFENSDAPVDRLRASTLIRLLSFIDTIEVKKVDLNKEIDDIFQKYKNGYNGLIICNKTDFSLIAKHFFELGMQVSNKAHKGEKI